MYGKTRSASARIKDWPRDERPREKLLVRGPGALSDAELIAVVLRTGTPESTVLDIARQLLVEHSGLGGLATRNPQELMRLPGMGSAKSLALLAAFEIGRRLQTAREGRVIIRSPEDVGRLMIPRLRDEPREMFFVLVLDSQNGVVKQAEITSGTLNASLVHPREVFKTAIDHRAASIIVVHNHPSGNREPSTEDIQVTRQLAETGRILDIPLNDHVIVAGNTYTSMAERGLV
jgi:DNA repair protein RadC